MTISRVSYLFRSGRDCAIAELVIMIIRRYVPVAIMAEIINHDGRRGIRATRRGESTSCRKLLRKSM